MMSAKGRYIYCISDAQGEKEFGPLGIGDNRGKVYSVVYKEIAAVVSDSPVVDFSVSRENTIAHMKVIERVMSGKTVLPVSFSTVASGSTDRSPEERLRQEVLKTRYLELKNLLIRMNNKVEMGLKAIWADMEAVFKETVKENREIDMLKERLASGDFAGTYNRRIELGRMVKDALEAKRAFEEERILKEFNGAYSELCRNKTFGDKMVTNSSFLVDKSRLKEFDERVDGLSSSGNGRILFRYVGPVPPCNFVELVISLEGNEGNKRSGL